MVGVGVGVSYIFCLNIKSLFIGAPIPKGPLTCKLEGAGKTRLRLRIQSSAGWYVQSMIG